MFKVYFENISTLLEDFSSGRAMFDSLYSRVSSERKAKTDRLRFAKDKCLSVAAENLLIKACRDCNLDYSRMRFIYNAYGKPFFADCPLYFNLSHSNHMAMCVIADCPVGCDIEAISCADMDIAKRFFSKAEFQSLCLCPPGKQRDNLFYRLWTLKESFIKCKGDGLNTALSSFTISFNDHKPYLTDCPDAILYTLQEYPLQECSIPKYSAQEHPVQECSLPKRSMQKHTVHEYSVNEHHVQECSLPKCSVQEHTVQECCLPKYPVHDYPLQKCPLPEYPKGEDYRCSLCLMSRTGI